MRDFRIVTNDWRLLLVSTIESSACNEGGWRNDYTSILSTTIIDQDIKDKRHKTRQDRAQDKARQDKARQDKARQDKIQTRLKSDKLKERKNARPLDGKCPLYRRKSEPHKSFNYTNRTRGTQQTTEPKYSIILEVVTRDARLGAFFKILFFLCIFFL